MVSTDHSIHVFQVTYTVPISIQDDVKENNAIEEEEVDVELHPIPKFECIQTVTVNKAGSMTCTCLWNLEISEVETLVCQLQFPMCRLGCDKYMC